MKLLLVGAFSFDRLDVGGQPVKSRELFSTLTEIYGSNSIKYIDTIYWKKRKIRTFLSVVFGFMKSDCVIMLPAQNGVLKFANLFKVLKKLRKHTKLFYDVIGGWLPDLLSSNKKLKSSLAVFNGIWVETDSMKSSLVDMGFKNVCVIPNYRNEDVIEFPFQDQLPHKLVIFSRVMREKGVDIAIEALTQLDKEIGRHFTLDIYGPVDESYRKDFLSSIDKSNGCVRYCGVERPENSKKIISNYFALLFPTRYSGEGMAGTIVDAIFAGCPVIASNWKYNSDIVNDKIGILFNPIDVKTLKEAILHAGYNSDEWCKKRALCFAEALKYTRRENAGKIIFELEKKDDYC